MKGTPVSTGSVKVRLRKDAAEVLGGVERGEGRSGLVLGTRQVGTRSGKIQTARAKAHHIASRPRTGLIRLEPPPDCLLGVHARRRCGARITPRGTTPGGTTRGFASLGPKTHHRADVI